VAYKNRISATVEYYFKKGIDLIQRVPLAPQTGFGFANLNSAGTLTKGFDITISARVIEKPFNWSSTLILSTLKDKVTSIELPSNTSIALVIKDSYQAMLNVKGKPLKGILSYKWAGLDPETGD